MPELPLERQWTTGDEEAQRSRHVERRVRWKGAVSKILHRDTPAREEGSGSDDEEGEMSSPRMPFRERLQYFKWNWFTVVMATGGMADVIHSLPFRFTGLETIGKVFLIFNIILFLVFCTLIGLRFYTHRGSFKRSFLDPSESLFIPASVISVGIILMTIAEYGIPETGRWLQITYKILFWIYAALAFMSSCCIYLILWSTQEFSLKTMTPIWVFPVYPLLIITPLATSLINAIPSTSETLRISSQNILAGALCIQGIGFLVSVIIYSAFLSRLMTQGLPASPLLPNMFVSVGPAGFTATGVIQLGTLASKALPRVSSPLGNSDGVDMIVRVLAFAAGLCLWGLTLWFFVLSVGGQWRCVWKASSRPNFDVSFFAFVFPNSALVSSTHAVGKAFKWRAVSILGCVFAGLLILTWFVVFVALIRGVWMGKLLAPRKEVPSEEKIGCCRHSSKTRSGSRGSENA